MNLSKKILLLCLVVIVFMFFFNSCESNEQKDKRHAEESFQSLQEYINNKNVLGFKELFNSVGSSSLHETDIEELFTTFSSGITLYETSYDGYLTVTDWIESDSYGKNICWAREIINNATGEHWGISVLECTGDQHTDDLGIIRLILYPIEKEDSFDLWWNDLEDEERPNGLILYEN